MACDKVTAEKTNREGDNNAKVKENDYVETDLLEVACEQALLFGQAKLASRERASEGPRKGELATISRKFSFPPRKPRDYAKRENCYRKRAAD